MSSPDAREQGQKRAGAEKSALHCTDVSSPQGHLTKRSGFTHRDKLNALLSEHGDVYLVRPGFIRTSVDNPGCKGPKEVSLQGYPLF